MIKLVQIFWLVVSTKNCAHHINSYIYTVTWTRIKKKCYNKTSKKIISFFSTDLILFVCTILFLGTVDLADQLQLQYCLNRSVRNRKWWWEIFLWELGIAVINACALYKYTFQKAWQKKKKIFKKRKEKKRNEKNRKE